MRRSFFWLAVALLPVTAAAETYECKTTNFGSGGWMSTAFLLDYDAAAETGSALDWGIQKVHGKMIPVDFERRSDTSYYFRWTNTGLEATNSGSVTLSYKVTLFTDRNAFTATGRLHGSDNIISGSGSCKRVR